MHRTTSVLLALVAVLLLSGSALVHEHGCGVSVARRLLATGAGGTPGSAPATLPPTDDSWTRSASNPILVASEAEEGGASGWVLEPTVLYESGTFKMWYTGGVSGDASEYSICYATSSDGISWTKYAGNPVLGKGGSGYAGVASRSHVFRLGTTYYIYFSNGTDLLRSTSTDGLTWTTPVTVITAASVGNGATAMTNSFVWQEGDTDWRMLIEIVGGATWYDRIGYFTSTDGLSWSIQNGGLPLASLLVTPAPDGGSMAPSLIRDGPTYHLWYHANPGTDALPQDIFHATSTNLIDWTISGAVLVHAGSGTFEYDQAADPSVIVVDGTAYLFYCGANNTTDEGGPWFKIGVATAPAN